MLFPIFQFGTLINDFGKRSVVFVEKGSRIRNDVVETTVVLLVHREESTGQSRARGDAVVVDVVVVDFVFG
jgi:hypothetical protein